MKGNMMNQQQPIRVAIAGLGRSGWNIHAAALSALKDQFTVAAVTDADAARCNEAVGRFECRAYSTFESLIGDKDVELVVVATPNQHHVQHALAAMRAGKHVVVEKPLATRSSEVARMIQTSKLSNVVLAPFQNRRYEAMFLKIREVIESGKLGRIVQIRLAVHGFGRRWDWQTLREFGGGQLNNTGPHFIDQLLVLFGDAEPRVFCRMDRALASGDAEDHVKVILHAPGAPLIDLEISSACAYGQDLWLVMGTAGGLRSSAAGLDWKYVDFSQMPDRPVESAPTPDRKYNSESLDWREESWSPPADATMQKTHQMFYHDLFRTIRLGEDQVITPHSVGRQIAVIEQCQAMNTHIYETEVQHA
jgi:predicted dehydrogenase